ncbi:MAG: hypothetical protein IKE91_01365 [Clostridia bacterium]|nr:hypothetical protein [Clostridia bacterium]
MDNMENNGNLVGKFTKKFIINYVVSILLLGVVAYVLVAILSAFISQKIISIINFAISTLVLWKVGITSVDMSLFEAKIDSNDVKAVRKNIYIFFFVLIAINILLTSFSNIIDVGFKRLTLNAALISILINCGANAIQYVALMFICKNRLNQKVLGEPSHNMLYLIILLIGLVVISCGVFLIPDSNDLLDEENAAMAEKYKDEDWEKIEKSYSSNEDSGVININVSLGHSERGVVKEYKVIRIVCTAYNKNNGKLLGKVEKYYEDVELEDNHLSFKKKFAIECNNKFIGSDYDLEVEAYGVRK